MDIEKERVVGVVEYQERASQFPMLMPEFLVYIQVVCISGIGVVLLFIYTNHRHKVRRDRWPQKIVYVAICQSKGNHV